MVRTRSMTMAGVALTALVLAACSNGYGGSGGGGTSGGGDTGTSAGGSGTVAVAKGDLGQMLVDSQGRTLYLFLSDTGSSSTCYGDCASTWPALTTGGTPSAGTGVDASMLGTTTRTDGGTQVTFDGHPLYMFSGDGAAGDTNGEGIGKVWYAVSPAGTPIKKAGGGYGGRY